MKKSTHDEYDFGGASNTPYLSRQTDRCIELTVSQIKKIKQTLYEADAGELAPTKGLAKANKKYASEN